MVGRHGIRRRRPRTRYTAAVAVVAACVALALVIALPRGAPRPTRPVERTTSRSPSATTLPAASKPTTPPAPGPWQVAWGSAMAWGYGTITDATVRALALVPIDGSEVKVRISNRFGTSPMTVASATVGQSATGSAVVRPTLVSLHFAEASSVTIPAGSSVVSDPVAMAVTPPETLAVSMYVRGASLMSSHYPCCEAQTPSYLSAPGSGDLTGRVSAAGFGYEAPYSRLLDAVEVQRPSLPHGVAAAHGSIVAVGDSITDGFNATTSWAAVLQQRLAALPVAARPAVINEGITANALTAVEPSDALVGGGPPGVQRLTEDALALPGVSTIVLFLGTNDLYFGASAADVIAGMHQAAVMAHQAGVRIVGVTLLPRAGSEHWSPQDQAGLDAVNAWLLTSHAFDGVLNLAPSVADVYNGMCNPSTMFPAYDSGDHLHPDAAGATAMANAVDLPTLALARLPPVPPLTPATSTLGCAGATAAMG